LIWETAEDEGTGRETHILATRLATQSYAFDGFDLAQALARRNESQVHPAEDLAALFEAEFTLSGVWNNLWEVAHRPTSGRCCVLKPVKETEESW
jgi:hypothetical protein